MFLHLVLSIGNNISRTWLFYGRLPLFCCAEGAFFVAVLEVALTRSRTISDAVRDKAAFGHCRSLICLRGSLFIAGGGACFFNPFLLGSSFFLAMERISQKNKAVLRAMQCNLFAFACTWLPIPPTSVLEGEKKKKLAKKVTRPSFLSCWMLLFSAPSGETMVLCSSFSPLRFP